MAFFKSVLIAFAMFSRLPMPRLDWSRENMRYAMAAFPLVGVVVGLAVLLWDMAAVRLGIGPLLRGAGLGLLPVAITGGIHLDGFCDTVDALSSHAEPERKQEILKDPHMGAFAAIAVSAYLVLYCALATELPTGPDMRCFALLFVLSRALSGFAVVTFPCARDSGLGRTFHDAAARTANGVILAFVAAACLMLLSVWGEWAGTAAALVSLLCLGYYRRVAMREFGGISGDLSGWFLQVCEMATLAVLVFAGKIIAVLSSGGYAP